MSRPELCELCSDDGKTVRALPLEHGLHCGDMRVAWDRGFEQALHAAIAFCDTEASQRDRNAATYRDANAPHVALAYTMAGVSLRKAACLLRELKP